MKNKKHDPKPSSEGAEKIDEKVIAEPEEVAETKADTEVAAETNSAEESQSAPGTKTKKLSLKGLRSSLRRHPRRTALGVVVMLLLLFVLPFTRYQALGLIMKKPVSFRFTDSKTGLPISEAIVNIRGQEQKTDNEGVVMFRNIKVGETKVTVSKKYYETLEFELLVGLNNPRPVERKVVALGRRVSVTVTDTISKKPLADATVTAGEVKSKTNNKGVAQLIVAPDAKEVNAEISLDSYIDAKGTIKPEDTGEAANKFTLTRTGKLYFLSKASGKIDVVKTNLDGSERQTVVAGTGKESETDTILLASRDWKYLALKSRRDGDKAKLYLIETATDKMTDMDEGNAAFTLVGWHGHYFVYEVRRENVQLWQPKQQALKSFNAETKELAILDETNGAGSAYDYAGEDLSNFYILDNLIVYTKFWSCYYYASQCGDTNKIIGVKPSGQDKKTLKSFPTASYGYATAKNYEPDEIYFYVQVGGGSTYVELEDGEVKEVTVTDEEFNKFYPTYLVSPTGNMLLWYEPRDGKNTIFVGNDKGKEEKNVLSLSELIPYGWFSDDYILLSKNSSELYIRGREDGEPVKITDYHKPAFDFRGYGYGYGGF